MSATTTTTKQKGVSVMIDARPGFTGYLNMDSPEDIAYKSNEEIDDETGRVVTRTGNDLTTDCTAKLVVKASTTLPAVYDILTETTWPTEQSAARSWMIMKMKKPRQAGKSLILELTLKFSEACAPTS